MIICLCAALGVCVYLVFRLEAESKARFEAEQKINELFSPHGWHSEQNRDYFNGSAVYRVGIDEQKRGAIKAPYLNTPFVVPHGYAKEVTAALNAAERYGKTKINQS
jgi:hypothetical protein